MGHNRFSQRAIRQPPICPEAYSEEGWYDHVVKWYAIRSRSSFRKGPYFSFILDRDIQVALDREDGSTDQPIRHSDMHPNRPSPLFPCVPKQR